MRKTLVFLLCVVALAAAGCASQRPGAEKPRGPYAVIALQNWVSTTATGPLLIVPGEGDVKLLVADLSSGSVVSSLTVPKVRAISDVGTSAGDPAVLAAAADGFYEVDLRTMRDKRIARLAKRGEPLGAAYAADGAKLLWEEVPWSPLFIVHRITASGEQTASLRFQWPKQDPRKTMIAWTMATAMLASESPTQATFLQNAAMPGSGDARESVTLWRADFGSGKVAQFGSKLPAAGVLWGIGRPEEVVRRWGVPSEMPTAALAELTQLGARAVIEPGGERYLQTRLRMSGQGSGNGTITVTEHSVVTSAESELLSVPLTGTGPLVRPLGVVDGVLVYERTDWEPAPEIPGSALLRLRPEVRAHGTLRLRDIGSGAESTVATWGVSGPVGPPHVSPIYLGVYR